MNEPFELPVTYKSMAFIFPFRLRQPGSAKVLKALSKGHPGEDNAAWLFADKIIVH